MEALQAGQQLSQFPLLVSCLLVMLSLISTGFIGLLLYIVGRALKGQETTQAIQVAMLKDITAIQEQIKTLFSEGGRHENDIASIENHLHGYSNRGRRNEQHRT